MTNETFDTNALKKAESKILSTIPETWIKTTLGECFKWGSGGTPKSSNPDYYGGSIPWLVIGDLNDGIVNKSSQTITEQGLKNSSSKLVEEGTLLLAMYGSIGKLGIAGMKLATNQAIAFAEKNEIDTKYLFNFLRFARPHLSKLGKGATQQNISQTVIKAFPFPLAPINEQKRIVAKIEELFSELDNGIAALKTAREQLKVYRQAVLKHAFEGKLTAQWRKDNADKLESPEQLLARIQQEREARYQQQLEEWNAAVKVWEAGAKEGRKPSKPIKPKTLSSVSQEESSKLGDIPDEWRWVRLGNIALIGTGVTPLKSNINFYEGGDIAWVTSGALNDAFVREPSDLITIRALNETNLRLYPPHTLVVALYGEGKTRGKCSELLIEAATNQAVAAIMLDDISSGLRRFVKGFLTKNYEDMRLFASGGVQPNLNLGIIENMAIPLCSVEEANEIAGLLEKKDSEIEHLASEIDRQIAKAVILRQSILKKAFSGQLVPQDPNDEPASELLARIQAERNAKKTSNTRKVK